MKNYFFAVVFFGADLAAGFFSAVFFGADLAAGFFGSAFGFSSFTGFDSFSTFTGFFPAGHVSAFLFNNGCGWFDHWALCLQAERREMFHQTAFAPRRVARMNGAFLRGYIQRADGGHHG